MDFVRQETGGGATPAVLLLPTLAPDDSETLLFVHDCCSVHAQMQKEHTVDGSGPGTTVCQ